MDFLGTPVICLVIAHYQRVLILRALKYFRDGTEAPTAPAVFTLNCSLACLSRAGGGNLAAVVSLIGQDPVRPAGVLV